MHYLIKFVYALRSLSSREKFIFLILFITFITGALLFLWRLENLFLIEIPTQGGVINEGVIGTPRFINPLIAVSDADRDMTALIYSGLMRTNNNGDLIPDLAEKVDISKDGLVYTFTLKDNLKWQDGKPITSSDILFTIQQAKDPTLKSPKRALWEGVDVSAPDEKTIKFTLKKPYSPFLENTTMGILPKHLWQGATSDQMIFSNFNINPVGSGPYKINKVNRNSSGIITSYELVPNKNFALGEPYISKFVMYFYLSEKDLINAYQKGEIDNINGLSPLTINNIKGNGSVLKTMFLPRIFAVFFNQNNAKIFSQKEVREALDMATDRKKIIDDVLAGYGTELNYPLPPGVLGSINNNDDTNKDFSIEKAKEILKNNGWTFNDGEKVWEKKIKKETMKLEFSLATSDAPDLKNAAEIIKKNWTELGAKVNLSVFELGDLNQNTIRPRKYDALLFGEIVGRDPDPFVFWHSSQRNDPGLNIALYTNPKVDKILEEARRTTDETERIKKYEDFQKELVDETPAIFLFSPDFLYLVSSKVRGLENVHEISTAPERFSQIYNWYIKTEKVWKIFAKREI